VGGTITAEWFFSSSALLSIQAKFFLVFDDLDMYPAPSSIPRVVHATHTESTGPFGLQEVWRFSERVN
jgi:hypothetical protein